MKPIAQHIRQSGGNDRANADKKTLKRKPFSDLILGQHIAHKCSKRLHRNIDARIQNPQQTRRHPQRA